MSFDYIKKQEGCLGGGQHENEKKSDEITWRTDKMVEAEDRGSWWFFSIKIIIKKNGDKLGENQPPGFYSYS